MDSTWLWEPAKLETGKTWEKFPTEKEKNSQSSQVSLGKFFRIGGGQEFSQSSQVHKKGGQKGLKTLIRPYIFRKFFTKFPSLEKREGQSYLYSNFCTDLVTLKWESLVYPWLSEVAVHDVALQDVCEAVHGKDGVLTISISEIGPMLRTCMLTSMRRDGPGAGVSQHSYLPRILSILTSKAWPEAVIILLQEVIQ